MKIIFLDMDGVVNNPREGRGRTLSTKAVELLNKLTETSGANIVISSSWRFTAPLIVIIDKLKEYGFRYPERVIGCTAFLESGCRGDEIKLWLKQVPVESFVILDDVDDMGNLYPHLVKTDHFLLMQEHDLKKAIAILERGVISREG